MLPSQSPSRASRLSRRAGSNGFTLIELMIVVAVVAILAAVAYPSYAEHIRKSRRAQAKADLVEYSQLAERSHTTNNTYASFRFGNGSTTTQSPREGGTAQYTITFTGNQSTFTLTAAPQGNQTKDTCATMTLNQAGVKTPTASANPGCW
ncbi:type IV pilin protein [Xanthomonas hortorum]|uniref:Type IV pilin protein n=1 Tax=Xanthomonas hortorum pv. vitians TaxID=83224 RepID=A0A6V7DNL9_9XANT|nr:type IV pilin protein [Xanthomonas hortorum]APP86912.1 pilus assembly protein PilE [Xanthomonas hortorum pv. gardneri]MCC8493103.1 prepilin-type N-terminal cleavage/methylation domain-containing protein [Xanthomonas hortorum pv. gardneri]MCE4280957.1 prepilin-type N-terminal cleavage/methylation domain-containing protein [Xanthomonas hortorum pv. vitians]MCE4286365.1 prepilin-type N-terminal cleavage/methylation domain-containing protein [Xanthomonas hortorum pv. vitians]MCE4290855.1 prepil